MLLLNPRRYARNHRDPKTRELLLALIGFFEDKGLSRIKADDQSAVWYADFLAFVAEHKVFSTLLTPAAEGCAGARWDLWRIEEASEILGFYGLSYWYTWQVSILGLGPIWMSSNKELKQKAAAMLEDGGIFAFGLSEKEHGADLYATEMVLTPEADGSFKAKGHKYYIGNGNKAALVSVFGKRADTGAYVFFTVDTKHPRYRCTKKIETSGVRQAFVAAFELDDYPIGASDILATGDEAWDAALNTVNIGKYQLGWASIGICTHAFYEALGHAAKRVLYGKQVTEFPHVKVLMTDAYARLCAMKLYALRACDYLRSAHADDRRYLLYNPIQKMKVTMEGEKVVELLHQVIAAKGFEQDTYFEMAIRDVGMLPKLEGTVHVNVALVTKFMQNFLFHPQPFPEIPLRDDTSDDAFLFDQGPTKGLGKVQFHDYRASFAGSGHLKNVGIFLEQIEALCSLLAEAAPSEAQSKNMDYMLQLGELFSLIPYGQLIAENGRLYQVDDALMDEIFRFIVSDFSAYAVRFHCGQRNSARQDELIRRMIRKPDLDEARAAKVWDSQVYPLRDAY
jgi:acyl-CoA dehydrogenase